MNHRTIATLDELTREYQIASKDWTVHKAVSDTLHTLVAAAVVGNDYFCCSYGNYCGGSHEATCYTIYAVVNPQTGELYDHYTFVDEYYDY